MSLFLICVGFGWLDLVQIATAAVNCECNGLMSRKHSLQSFSTSVSNSLSLLRQLLILVERCDVPFRVEC